MTFNPELRERLLTTPAVDIILANLDEGLMLTKSPSRLSILKELETESWSNGSRGREKDGKAKPMPCDSIHKAFVSQTAAIQVMALCDAPKLKNYQVIAELDSAAQINEMEMSKKIIHL